MNEALRSIKVHLNMCLKGLVRMQWNIIVFIADNNKQNIIYKSDTIS